MEVEVEVTDWRNDDAQRWRPVRHRRAGRRCSPRPWVRGIRRSGIAAPLEKLAMPIRRGAAGRDRRAGRHADAPSAGGERVCRGAILHGPFRHRPRAGELVTAIEIPALPARGGRSSGAAAWRLRTGGLRAADPRRGGTLCQRADRAVERGEGPTLSKAAMAALAGRAPNIGRFAPQPGWQAVRTSIHPPTSTRRRATGSWRVLTRRTEPGDGAGATLQPGAAQWRLVDQRAAAAVAVRQRGSRTTPLSRRTWNRWHFARRRVGLSVCIPTYMLAAA
jgi:hypothetical protein